MGVVSKKVGVAYDFRAHHYTRIPPLGNPGSAPGFSLTYSSLTRPLRAKGRVAWVAVNIKTIVYKRSDWWPAISPPLGQPLSLITDIAILYLLY